MMLELKDPQIAKTYKEMLTVTNDNGHYKVSINYSSLDLIMTCPRKAFYSLHEKLTVKDESPALVFGTAMHKALETWYQSDFSDRIIPVNALAKAQALVWNIPEEPCDELLLECVRQFALAGHALQALGTNDKRSLENGAKILVEYARTYRQDGLRVYKHKNEPCVEKLLRSKIYQDERVTIDFFGTIDVILENQELNEIFVCDHKTTSSLGKDFFNRIKPNHQYTGYLYLAQQCLGIETTKFMVNGIQVAKTKHEFARQFTERNEEDFQELLFTLVYAVGNYIDSMESGIWPMNTPGPCTMWGGCSYLEVCHVPEKIRDSIISSRWIKG